MSEKMRIDSLSASSFVRTKLDDQRNPHFKIAENEPPPSDLEDPITQPVEVGFISQKTQYQTSQNKVLNQGSLVDLWF